MSTGRRLPKSKRSGYKKPTKAVYHNQDRSKTVVTRRKGITGRTHVETAHKKSTNWKLIGYCTLLIFVLAAIGKTCGY